MLEREADGVPSMPMPITSPDTKIQVGLVFGDTHLRAGAPAHWSYSLFREFAGRFRWNWIVDLGDDLELDYLASFNRESVRVMAEGRFKRDYDLLEEHIGYLSTLTDRLIILQGNHDERIDRFLEAAPMFEELIDYESYFRLIDRGVLFVKQIDQPFKLGKLHFCHGWYSNKYHTAKHLDEVGGNVIYGHVHKFQQWSKVRPARFEEIGAWSVGCLCGKLPKWKKGAPSGWQNGFAVVYMDADTGNFNVYPVMMVNGAFMFGGERWAI